MSRRDRFNLTRRLARLEGGSGPAGRCICANPIRMASTLAERKDIEETCPECGGWLIVVQLNFGSDPPHPKDCTCPEHSKIRATLEKVVPKALVVGSRSKIDLTKLSDGELGELKEALTPPEEREKTKSPKAWRSKQSREEDMSILDMEF